MGDIIAKQLKSGGVSYKARVRRAGQPLLTKTFKRKTDARKWLSIMESKMLEGKNLPKPRRTTLAQAIDRYILEVMPSKKPNTQAVELSRLEFWKKEFGELRLVDIDYDTLIRARKLILDTPVARKGRKEGQVRGPATANRYMALLRHLYSVAIREWGLVDSNPLVKVRALKESNGRARILTDAELKLILGGLEIAEREDFRPQPPRVSRS